MGKERHNQRQSKDRQQEKGREQEQLNMQQGNVNSLKLGLSHSSLHIIAMLIMLCDHIATVVLLGDIEMNAIGRLSFPIFCFLLVEGFYHTHDVKKYMKRLLFFGLLSEIPYNLAFTTNLLNNKHQNVMWTFLIAMFTLVVLDGIRKNVEDKLSCYLMSGMMIFFAYSAANALYTDYKGAGVLQVVLFYYMHENKWYHKLVQVIGMYIINVKLLNSYLIVLRPFGFEISVTMQGLAILALLFIWLYNGNKGIKNKVFQKICYWFYPVHLFILSLFGG